MHVSIISLAISFNRCSRCDLNSGSGQCRSLMKHCNASSFQNNSSLVAQPFLEVKFNSYCSMYEIDKVQQTFCLFRVIKLIKICIKVNGIKHIKLRKIVYPLISHRSFSKPLWSDWAMDDSMRSTYRTTRGANVSRKCSWKRPPFRFSAKNKSYEWFHSDIFVKLFNLKRICKLISPTIRSEVVIQNLEQRERIPSIWRLFC